MVVVADGLGFTFPAREDLAAVAAHADIIVRDALIEILNHMLCRKIRHRLIKRIENLTFDMSSHVVKGAEVDGGQQVFNVGDDVAGDAASAEVVDDVAAAEAKSELRRWSSTEGFCRMLEIDGRSKWQQSTSLRAAEGYAWWRMDVCVEGEGEGLLL